MTAQQRVTVLGLGGLGRALAERAQQSGRQVTVWNRTPGKNGTLAAAASAEEAVNGADAVFLVVRDASAVLQVCDEKLMASLPPTPTS